VYHSEPRGEELIAIKLNKLAVDAGEGNQLTRRCEREDFHVAALRAVFIFAANRASGSGIRSSADLTGESVRGNK